MEEGNEGLNTLQWALTGNVRRMRRKSLIGQVVLFALGVQLLVFASFTCLQLPTASGRNLERAVRLTTQQAMVYLPPRWQQQFVSWCPSVTRPVAEIRYSPYVPLLPASLFVGYVLGLPLGALSAAGFVLLGLVGPWVGVLPFAGGGGPDYCRQPTFGYLLGMIVAAWFAGRVTVNSSNSLRQLFAVAGGLLTVHAAGLLFLVGGSLGVLVFEGDANFLKWQPWLFENIRNLSWYTLPYDALLSLCAVGLAFPFRWLTATLTAPDIAMRPKTARVEPALEQVS